MQIGQVAQLTGFSRDTIRWYEKIGLIKLNRSLRSRSNYRVYSADVVERLLTIKQLKLFGFTLKETADLLVMEDLNEMNCSSVSGLINNKLEKIDHEIFKLLAIRGKLIQSKRVCTGNCKDVLTNQ